jgi:RimJ/RimL family protein N-acetyltransferase
MESSWQSGIDVVSSGNLPDGYSLAQMSETDISPVITRLAQWYPEIQAGAESLHLRADFYRTHTQLTEATEERAVLPLVIRHRDDGVVAVITFERNVLARSITCRMGALAPEHRKAGLALLGPQWLQQLGHAIGAEVAYYYATLRTRHQQLIAERSGFRLVGIVPGHDRCEVAPGEVKRVYDALYSKLLVSDEHLQVPPIESFTAKTRAVWNALFASQSVD